MHYLLTINKFKARLCSKFFGYRLSRSYIYIKHPRSPLVTEYKLLSTHSYIRFGIHPFSNFTRYLDLVQPASFTLKCLSADGLKATIVILSLLSTISFKELSNLPVLLLSFYFTIRVSELFGPTRGISKKNTSINPCSAFVINSTRQLRKKSTSST